MQLTLTDEQKMIQETVRDFIRKELIPLEIEFIRNEREGRTGISKQRYKEIQLKGKEVGYWGLSTPEKYGGTNLDLLTRVLINIELGKTIIPFHFGGDADNILYHCNEEQKEKYLYPVINGDRLSCFALTEPGAGSDARNIQTTAIKDGNEWIINGEKIFITNGNEADFAIVFAVTDKEKGGHGGVTCFLVDREMGWKSENIHTIDGWDPASLLFDHVRVPEENILGEVGHGFELGMKWITNGRTIIPARAIGIAERLLQMGIDYSKTRIAFNHPISEYQAIQWMLAESAVEIEASKWLVYNAAYTADIGKPSQHSATIAKLYGANMVNRVVDRILQIHGGMGLTKELPIELWYRSVRKYRVFEGTDEILKRTIARNLLSEKVKVGSLS
jgi:acyl-CoA dehydrogenase